MAFKPITGTPSLFIKNMKAFEEYFSPETIILYLCKTRAKMAKGRNKKHLLHMLTNSENYNYHKKEKERNSKTEDCLTNSFIKYQTAFAENLNKLLPPRKKWVKLGKPSRTDKKNNQVMSSTDKNIYSLLKTIKKTEKKNPNEPWLLLLKEFINEVQTSISSSDYKITPPFIYPKLKEEVAGISKCRPISLFALKDRVILSLTNKFFTLLFDRYFENCSFAFRSRKNKENTATLSHHDCIKELLAYKNNYQNIPLWVVECDMEKFYDSVNHNIVKNGFEKFIALAKEDYPNLSFEKPIHVFREFLDCYAFNKDVPSKNDTEFWKSFNITSGMFEWVENRLNELNYYKNINDERIGVPQGGALSGLIANIVLDFADKEMLKHGVFYIRFCDDMIIIDPEINKCQQAKDAYINSLKALKLVPHNFNNLLSAKRKKIQKKLPELTLEPFWKGKSKGPYKWDSLSNNGYPWIGFVGYELNHEGLIRVRKKSINKEIKKQQDVVDEIKKAISKGMRKNRGSIAESAIHRLIGMSVGRVTLKNYKTASNDLCWKNGFRELFKNKYAIKQIKQLDRNRNRLYYNLQKTIKEPDVETKKIIPPKNRQVVHFNKPFSYYYQVLERSVSK
ncbi:MAG: hypothetical protein HYZ10_04025 [Ignavibacteriales bacterium]|nr:hypothetical protein [Ignavibacteriales bacterium]